MYFGLDYIGYVLTRHKCDFPLCYHSQGHSTFLVSTTLSRLRSVNLYNCPVFDVLKLISVVLIFILKHFFAGPSGCAV